MYLETNISCSRTRISGEVRTPCISHRSPVLPLLLYQYCLLCCARCPMPYGTQTCALGASLRTFVKVYHPMSAQPWSSCEMHTQQLHSSSLCTHTMSLQARDTLRPCTSGGPRDRCTRVVLRGVCLAPRHGSVGFRYRVGKPTSILSPCK